MDRGFVGIVTADLHLPTAASLKDKRKPLAGLKAALVRATGASVSGRITGDETVDDPASDGPGLDHPPGAGAA